MAIQRYAVIDGKETNRQQTMLPMTVSADTVYRVGVDVNDQSFTLMVQGKVVDFWSEEQLKTRRSRLLRREGRAGVDSKYPHVSPERYDRQTVCRADAPKRSSKRLGAKVDMNPRNRRPEDASPKAGSGNGTNGSANGGANGSGTSALAKAVSLHLEGKRQEALQELKGAMSHAGETAEFCSAMGHIQFELEQYEDAAKSYTKLLALEPKHMAGQFNLAVCLEKLGRWEEAADRFTKVLEEARTARKHVSDSAICQLHLEKSEAALENFDRVLTENPSNETAMFGKAVGLQLTWRFDEATDIYKSVLSKNADAEEALINLVTIGIARKDIQTIREYSERLIQAAAEFADRARGTRDLRLCR